MIRGIFGVFATLMLMAVPVSAFSEGSSEPFNLSATFDKFHQETEYDGPIIRELRSTDSYYYRDLLRSFRKGEGPVREYQIYVEAHYTAPHFIVLNRAFDDQGHRLHVSMIDHEVGRCRFSETFGDVRCMLEEDFAIDVTRAYLLHMQNAKDVAYRVEGDGDSVTFHVPGAYIKQYLIALRHPPKAKAEDDD